MGKYIRRQTKIRIDSNLFFITNTQVLIILQSQITLRRKPAICNTGFPKPNTNLLPNVVTTFSVSNKTGYSYFKWGKCREKNFCEFQKV